MARTSAFHEPLTVDNAAVVMIDHQTGTMLMGIEDIVLACC